MHSETSNLGVKGLWTALITPFKKGNGIDNEIDYIALEKLLKSQIEARVDGVLLLGTTGETPTLTKQEQLDLVKFAINILKKKTKIMVNIGTYSTKASLENLKLFENIEDIDAYLVVNPYYNKPTQTGLYKHFSSIAKASSRNIILYNIKGRTGVNLETATLLKIIEENPNVIGVKEASGNLQQMKEVVQKTPKNFLVLSGDDALTFDLIQNGGDGVISVASNLFPKMMKGFVDSCFENKQLAEKLNNEYKEFFSKLFIQTNPLPAKTYLAYKGIIEEEFRLPMCRMDEDFKKEFLDFMQNFNN